MSLKKSERFLSIQTIVKTIICCLYFINQISSNLILSQAISKCLRTKSAACFTTRVGRACDHGADRDAGLEQHGRHTRQDPASTQDYTAEGK